jgi:hypothetical protein
MARTNGSRWPGQARSRHGIETHPDQASRRLSLPLAVGILDQGLQPIAELPRESHRPTGIDQPDLDQVL